MLRILTIAVFVATLSVTAVLYKLKYETRSLQLSAVELRRQIEAERAQLAVLKAEWSVLTQPARIDQLAGELGLKPLSPKQIVTSRELDGLARQPSKPVAVHKDKKRNGAVKKIGFQPGATVERDETLSGFNDDFSQFAIINSGGDNAE